jgi:hypothetical protein
MVGCGGAGPPPTTRPAPAPGAPPPAPSVATPVGPLRYRQRSPLVYELFRYDTLVYASMPGAPQASGKRAILTVRPVPGRTVEADVRLDSLEALEDTRLSTQAIDSSLGTRWQVILGPAGPMGSLMGGRRLIISGQIEAMIRLLFPQLPSDGLREESAWSDSSAYRIQLDAFDASESAARTSRAAADSAGSPGLAVEATERLVRTGSAMQGGQLMTLQGTGGRRLSYQFAFDGWLTNFTARDSLDMVVAVTGQTIPVRWRSTLIARLRDTPLR